MIKNIVLQKKEGIEGLKSNIGKSCGKHKKIKKLEIITNTLKKIPY